MKSSTFLLLYLLFSFQLFSQNENKQDSKPINLLTKDLRYWIKYIGVPHYSVTGLPKGTPTGDGMKGTPLGMNDPKHVFKVIRLDGEKVIKVSGEIYGGLTTKSEYENYHLHLKYKWGIKKYAPRLTLPRDMGIMFHVNGNIEDAMWSVFMMGLECQICEKTSGDFFLVANKIQTPVADSRLGEGNRWDINAPSKQIPRGTFPRRSENNESDSTKWTTMDVYTVGRSGVFLVNGHVVNAYQNAGIWQADKTITPLTKGKIQLQSEGAEAYYKDISIRSISEIPYDIKKAAGLD